ncbi:MAG: opacity protein-like surface antigen [Candidatus Midichloriaceae bacterium]|jgi:opacity protein-like surface antigen
MKKLLLTTCCTMLAITTCISQQKHHNKNTFKKLDKFYVQGNIGGYLPGHKIDNQYSSGAHKVKKGMIGSFFIGKKINDNFRIDFQYLKPANLKINDSVRNKSDTATVTFKQKIKVDNFFLNAYYDFTKHPKINPYIGAGIGYSKVKPGIYRVSDPTYKFEYKAKKSNNFAFNAKLGAIYKLTDKISLDTHYSYVNAGKGDKFTSVSQYIDNIFQKTDILKDSKKSKIDFHAIMVGIRYNF